jgi:hypothetical protein
MSVSVTPCVLFTSAISEHYDPRSGLFCTHCTDVGNPARTYWIVRPTDGIGWTAAGDTLAEAKSNWRRRHAVAYGAFVGSVAA